MVILKVTSSLKEYKRETCSITQIQVMERQADEDLFLLIITSSLEKYKSDTREK